jgi:alanine racemase
MLDQIKKLLGKTYLPLNGIEINSLFLRHNYIYLSALNAHLKIAPVLKSNAYGHGIVQVAKVLDGVGAPFFCVDSIYEAYELLKVGIKTKILIMGYIDPENLKVKRLPFSYAVYNEEQLRAINHYQKGAGVHIKFDSGMHRLGVQLENLPEFISAIKQYSNITIEGFMSHFAESEHPTSALTMSQVTQYKQALDMVTDAGYNPKWIHHGNSGAVLNQETLKLAEFTNMARVGLAIYGIDPRVSEEIGNNRKQSDRSDDTNELKPVLRLTTKIVQIKQIRKGDKVGYGGTFTAKDDMTIAILPIGYYDGVDRRLSNKGVMVVDGQPCPIVGRVSMNIAVIDVSVVIKPTVGQTVLVFSDNPKDANSVQHSAQLAETIPYDLLVHLASSTRREIV